MGILGLHYLVEIAASKISIYIRLIFIPCVSKLFCVFLI